VKPVSQNMPCKFIVYACPVGQLAEQLARYSQISLVECGVNAAHKYMPHCTLTGFFRDELGAISLYLHALTTAYQQALSTRPQPAIIITEMTFQPQWHGLQLQSPWLRQLTAKFATMADSPTRQEALRLKDWLHLSLAYEFTSEQQERLAILAQEIVNPQATVEWELRFYQQHSDGLWTCHQTWQLT